MKTSSSRGVVVEAKTHTPAYMMHKYFARRPWNVFAQLVEQYSNPGDIVLDPFCGGGVTVVEGLRLRRNVVAVDSNPLATYITQMEARPVDLADLNKLYLKLSERIREEILALYRTECRRCKSPLATADWIEWYDNQIVKMKIKCPSCGASMIVKPTREDQTMAQRTASEFEEAVSRHHLWYPRASIPRGDKTSGLLNSGTTKFSDLFTKRNLLALAILRKAIYDLPDDEAREFLAFVFSGALKWASRMSHLRGHVVEGWALHAYWIYPKSLEINVWNTFDRRYRAIVRGKEFSNHAIGHFFREAKSYDDLASDATCWILTGSSTHLPLPDESINCIITDPPYGGNVNYGELADYWLVWQTDHPLDKQDEIVVNRSQGKRLEDYERMLSKVVVECHRVLKAGRNLVATFNSRDSRVVSSFVLAACQAGFLLDSGKLTYQPPIRPYSTTFHAMQIGAFTGDFVFVFNKAQSDSWNQERMKLADFEVHLDELINEPLSGRKTEPEVREKAYRLLIPFIAAWARHDADVCHEAANYFELTMRRFSKRFAETRKAMIKQRRMLYAN